MRLLYTNSNSLSSRLITGFDSGGVSHGGLEFPQYRPGEVLDSTWRHGGVKWWPKPQWLTMHVIDFLFVWQNVRPEARGHCHNAYLNEADRTGCPPELR